ncbi:MAG: tetratricopeptide repeat protein [Bryobacteraceae bacterium]|nr:tetratricopeptide repeat protein [Bryobacteraceae bacterium]
MATDRIELLKNLLAQDPKNTFARYGMAMEYANRGRLEEAVKVHEELLADDPGYGASYYHCGQALEKLGRYDDARSLYERGIEATTKSGDLHTRSEIQAALDLLP